MGFAPSTMQLTSTAFAPMARIPKHYTGEGAGLRSREARGGDLHSSLAQGDRCEPAVHELHICRQRPRH